MTSPLNFNNVSKTTANEQVYSLPKGSLNSKENEIQVFKQDAKATEKNDYKDPISKLLESIKYFHIDASFKERLNKLQKELSVNDPNVWETYSEKVNELHDEIAFACAKSVLLQIGVPEEKINKNTKLADIDFDELNLIQVSLVTERYISGTFPNDKLQGAKTIGDIVNVFKGVIAGNRNDY